MKCSARVLAFSLAGGLLAGIGFAVSTALADSFIDVPAANVFADDIDWLTDYDIAVGFPNGSFDPRAPVKRQQAAQWFHRFRAELELVTETADPPAGAEFTHTVFCPDDKRPLSVSGFTSDATHVVIADSVLLANSGFIRWRSTTVRDPASISVTLLCAPRI